MLSKSFSAATGTLVAAMVTACTAHAGPPAFPNLGSYTPANPSDFTINLPSPGIGSVSTVYFLTPYPNNTVQGTPIKALPPNHSITVDGVICGVDGAGMTACKDPQGRGFILSPSWSGWSAHIG
jgi:hypothetical protein